MAMLTKQRTYASVAHEQWNSTRAAADDLEASSHPSDQSKATYLVDFGKENPVKVSESEKPHPSPRHFTVKLCGS